MSRFDTCFDFLMRWEGTKFENDPSDPGGATKFGIDQRSHPGVNIRTLTRAKAKEIYEREKWDRFRCGELPAPWDLLVVNAAVNPGEGWAPAALQKAVGTKPDGFIGPKTIAAAKAATFGQIQAFLRAMEDYYRARPAKLNGRPFRDRYLAGWLNRVQAVRDEVTAA